SRTDVRTRLDLAASKLCCGALSRQKSDRPTADSMDAPQYLTDGIDTNSVSYPSRPAIIPCQPQQTKRLLPHQTLPPLQPQTLAAIDPMNRSNPHTPSTSAIPSTPDSQTDMMPFQHQQQPPYNPYQHIGERPPLLQTYDTQSMLPLTTMGTSHLQPIAPAPASRHVSSVLHSMPANIARPRSGMTSPRGTGCVMSGGMDDVDQTKHVIGSSSRRGALTGASGGPTATPAGTGNTKSTVIPVKANGKIPDPHYDKTYSQAKRQKSHLVHHTGGHLYERRDNMTSRKDKMFSNGEPNSDQLSSLDRTRICQAGSQQARENHTQSSLGRPVQTLIAPDPVPTTGVQCSSGPSGPLDHRDSLFFSTWNVPQSIEDPFALLSDRILSFLYSADSPITNERTSFNQYFSAGNVRTLLEKYTEVSVRWPILHTSAFCIVDAYTGLLVGMCCLGAHYSALIQPHHVRDLTNFLGSELARDLVPSADLVSKQQSCDAGANTSKDSHPYLEKLQALAMLQILVALQSTPQHRTSIAVTKYTDYLWRLNVEPGMPDS
ncbi:uncharacterized protein CCOS01_16977, partial [Colletotrichum costaricense]